VTTFLRILRRLESEIEFYGFGYETDTPEQGAPMSVEATYVEQIKRANQEVFSLYEMARDFGASLNLEEALALLTNKIGEFVPYDTCLVYLLDDDDSAATAAHVDGRNSDVLLGKRVIVGEGATGYVLKKRKPVENVAPSLDFAFSHAEICEHYVGMASVPLLAEEKLVGAISVFSGKLAVYEEEHLRLLETIARIAADAISKSIKHAESEVHAQTDPLTGLPNARGLHLQFEKEIGRARRTNSPLQLLMLDLDGFKAVNDTFGHKAGDMMLKEVGRIIKAELRDYDFLARYGGDEFVALIPETDNADVIELGSRIEAAVCSYALSIDGSLASVGVSVGAAGFPTQGESFEQLLIAADKAMYRTKAFHKQRLVRLGESAGSFKEEESIQAYVVDGPPIAEIPQKTYSRENDLVVELDESHIVVVNTVN
jgi:diguanylate cyclase (GGDEF)-like protein